MKDAYPFCQVRSSFLGKEKYHFFSSQICPGIETRPKVVNNSTKEVKEDPCQYHVKRVETSTESPSLNIRYIEQCESPVLCLISLITRVLMWMIWKDVFPWPLDRVIWLVGRKDKAKSRFTFIHFEAITVLSLSNHPICQAGAVLLLYW
jgi:hypothetical protein